ncbi:TPA: hypothetical protein ACYKIP_000927 [Campylobacter coli]|nr:hypothetical protein [Campylobacter coli]HEB8312828.1 hypothetical protein [Campylobacter coli]HEB8315706.1 hypothetical protein [Campylobacter coli]HEB8317552.1 hypothetical protein [Campylobacter coli]
MKFYNVITMVIFILFFAGCSVSGMITADHNGKMYWVPADCPRYKYFYNEPDKLICTDSNGIETGRILYPADEQQIADYRYEQQRQDEISQRNMEQLRQNTENLKEINRHFYENFMPKRHDVYIHY